MNNWHTKAFYRVSLKALIRNEQGQILTVSEYNGSNVSLPGGGLDYGESAHECLKRELYEEIGLTSDFSEKLIHMQTRWLETKQAWLMWLTYEIHYDELDYSIGVDGVKVEWLNEDAIDKDNVPGKMINTVLKDAREQ